MSMAALHASKFYEEAARGKSVFTLLSEDSFLVVRTGDGEAVPFWSSAPRVEQVRAAHPKYVHYDLSEISLTEFLDKTLPQLEDEAVKVGVNWSGAKLTGFDVSAFDVQASIAYWVLKG